MERLGEVQGGAGVVPGTGTHAHLRQVGAAQIRVQGLLFKVSTHILSIQSSGRLWLQVWQEQKTKISQIRGRKGCPYCSEKESSSKGSGRLYSTKLLFSQLHLMASSQKHLYIAQIFSVYHFSDFCCVQLNERSLSEVWFHFGILDYCVGMLPWFSRLIFSRFFFPFFLFGWTKSEN